MPKFEERHIARSALLTSALMTKVILPLDVIRVLHKAKIRFVLVGAYGLAGWRKETRTTEDVDVVVSARQVKKAVKELCEAFPNLESFEVPVVVRLRDRDSHIVAIHVMKPLQQPYREVFKHTRLLKLEGESYRVPSLEMALVMKFSAMTSLYRADEDKYR